MFDWLIMLKIIKNKPSKPSFVSQKMFSENFVAIHLINQYM